MNYTDAAQHPEGFAAWLRACENPEETWNTHVRGDYLLEVATELILLVPALKRRVVNAACCCAASVWLPQETLAGLLVTRLKEWVDDGCTLVELVHVRTRTYGEIWNTADPGYAYAAMAAYTAACLVDNHSTSQVSIDRPLNAAHYAGLAYAVNNVLNTREAEGLLPHDLWRRIALHPSRHNHLNTLAEIVRAQIPWDLLHRCL